MTTTRTWENQVHRDSRTPGPIGLHLRWTKRSPTTTSGRWQVTTLAPPSSATNWEHPPGLIASGDVGRPPATGELDISFTPPALRSSNERGHRLARPILPPDRFYVRIVGLDVQGNPSGPPSNAIVVNWIPPASIDKIKSPEELRKEYEEAAKKKAADAPARLSLTFEPFQGEKAGAHYNYVITQDCIFGKKGETITLKPSSDNWLDDVGDAFGDAGDFIADSANWVSNAWNDVKAFAVDKVADALPFECNKECRWALAKGLDTGLAAMGIPPSIPNFDELSKAGKGYLVQTLVDQSGYPIPPEAAQAIVDRMYDAAKEQADGAGSGTWLRPDPAFMARPAIATVTIVSQKPTEVRDLVLIVRFYGLYDFKLLPLPPILPGGQLTVPVVLDPPWYQEVLWEIEAERRKSGSKAFINDEELGIAWRTSHDHDKNTLDAWLIRAGDQISDQVARTSASFVAAAGYSAQ
jgi:hypothetical protein